MAIGHLRFGPLPFLQLCWSGRADLGSSQDFRNLGVSLPASGRQPRGNVKASSASDWAPSGYLFGGMAESPAGSSAVALLLGRH